MDAASAIHQAASLARQGRLADAMAIAAQAAGVARPAPELLELQAGLFKMAGDPDAALGPQRRLTQLYPQRRSGWHNLAATLGDLGLAVEAEAAARQSLTIPPNAPETYLVLGRSLQSQGRYDEAEDALSRALALRPAYPDAHRDLAQLRWMRSGDTATALARLRQEGDIADLALIAASVLEFSGDLEGAAHLLADTLAREPGSLAVRLAASSLDLALGRTASALKHARIVDAAAPNQGPAVLAPLVQALLASGQPDEALRRLEPWRRGAPDDQLAIALQLTAWRALDDHRYRALTDPATVVRAFTLPTPPGWPDLPAYLRDLKSTLEDLHDLKTHPLHQSLRGGSQTSQSLLRSTNPVITAFFDAVRTPLSAYLAALGQGTDPLRGRSTGAGKPKTAWSVRLQPKGRHANHVHPQGWISSAFYVDTPTRAIDGGDQAGWLRFGEPAFPVTPPQGPLHAVRPEPGRLVLFPSYLWHGTVPFETDETRLTIAFDVLPA